MAYLVQSLSMQPHQKSFSEVSLKRFCGVCVTLFSVLLCGMLYYLNFRAETFLTGSWAKIQLENDFGKPDSGYVLINLCLL